MGFPLRGKITGGYCHGSMSHEVGKSIEVFGFGFYLGIIHVFGFGFGFASRGFVPISAQNGIAIPVHLKFFRV